MTHECNCGCAEHAVKKDKVVKALGLIKSAQDIYATMTEEEKTKFNEELEKIS